MVTVDDEYARRHMAGEGDVLFFDKTTMPRWLRLTMAGTLAGGAAVVVGTGLASGDPKALLLLPLYGVGALAQLSVWTLRTAVTRENVHIQYGLWGPKIAAQKITRAEVVSYDWKRYGGWGIRRSLRDGTLAYNMMGDQGRAVRIEYRDNGKTRVVLVSAARPEQLAAAIREAAGLERSLDDVRDDLGVKGAVDEEEAEAEAEVEAALRR